MKDNELYFIHIHDCVTRIKQYTRASKVARLITAEREEQR